MINEAHKILYKANDLAEIMQISKGMAYIVMRRSDFPTIKIGKLVRVEKEQFQNWLLKQSK